MKISDILKDQADPLGDAGLNVDPDLAEATAAVIREILSRSSQEAKEFNDNVGHDELFAAWRLLGAVERSAFKELVRLARAHN